MTWTTTAPTQPGWYWWRNLRAKREAEIIYLRWYRDQLALGNFTLKGFTLLETGEWSGPIAEPEEGA